MKFRSDVTVELVDANVSDTLVARAARVSTGTDTKQGGEAGLIDFLMRERHGSPFEHGLFTFRVEAPIFVWREHMRHRIASYNEECLAGDTLITRVAPNGSTHKKNSKIETMWHNWHIGVTDIKGRTRKLKSCQNILVRSFDEKTKRPQVSKVIDIVKSTGKETWLVSTESGKHIRTSLDHKYFTPNGWKRLSQLNVGDYVYRNGLVRVNGEPVIPPRLRQGIQIWTTQLKPHIIATEGANCYLCRKHLEYNEVELDHEIPVVIDLTKALDPNNIKPICKDCHRIKTSSEQKYASRGVNGSIRADKIVSISDPKQEDTYDLVLEGPHHNFLANGVVVHNSGRYKQLEPVFYVPAPSRNLVQEGKPGAYTYVPGTENQYSMVKSLIEENSKNAYRAYEMMLSNGVAREVARMTLPVNIYSSAYVSMNPRALMNFLSLRNAQPEAAYPTHPQREIEMVAVHYETQFHQWMPITHNAFVKNGRICP